MNPLDAQHAKFGPPGPVLCEGHLEHVYTDGLRQRWLAGWLAHTGARGSAAESGYRARTVPPIT